MEDESPTAGIKRPADLPAEALDPRSETFEGETAVETGGVLQAYEGLDEPAVQMPEEAWDVLEDEPTGDSADHPDTWDEQRWELERHRGKAKELKSLSDYGVYSPVPRDQSTGRKFITTRWEEVPKWKQGRWIVRSRFVAREFKWKDPGRDDLFGVTSSANTGRILDYILVKKGYRAYLADCHCAFFHAPEDEEVYVEPPDEWKRLYPDQDLVWLLQKQLYGRRPAPRAFSNFIAGVLTEKIGMKRCIEVPHLFYHEETEVCLEVHVDDFYAVGPGESAGNLLKRVAEYMTLTLEGPFDIGSTYVHLKRVRTMTPEGLYISSSSSHLKKLLELTDLTETSKGKDTPITKPVTGEGDEPEIELSPTEATRFRAVVGILMYISTDRPDIQYVVNELSGIMSKPTQRSWEAAKHLVRYLIKTKGYALFFDRSVENCDDVVVMTDSDWATDRQSRKSKSAVHIYVGNCLLYSFTRRQTVIAQSSGEAEYYATASGVSEGLLIRKILAFFTIVLGLRAVTDSAANNSMAHRLGVGRIRHLETKALWLQQLVYRGLLTMSWSPGKYNNSDLGTKLLQKARFQELVQKAGLRDMEENETKILQLANVLAKTAGPSKEQVGQALAILVGWLQVQQANGSLTESKQDSSDETPSLLMIACAIFLFGLLAGWMISVTVRWWCKPEPLKLKFFKGPSSTVLHLDQKCHHLKRTKKPEEWTLCQWCSKVKLKID